MGNTILFGNGINLIDDKCPSWNEMLEELSNVELNEDLPNTQKYEMIISNSHFRDSIKITTRDGFEIYSKDGYLLSCQSDLTYESELKQKISKRLNSIKKNDIHRRLLDLRADHYMTTNFDVALLEGLKYVSSVVTTLDCLIRGIKADGSVSSFYYWPIHGIQRSPESILLGYDDYCSRIGDMNDYINGKVPGKCNYENLRKHIGTDSVPNEISSWIDLFFTSNVHIIGLGLSYDELDLWWLLNIRKRIMREDASNNDSSSLINNKIYYYSPEYIDAGKRQILMSYNIEIIEPKYLHTDYQQRYEDLIDVMELNFKL